MQKVGVVARGLQARDIAPKEQLQQLQRRCGHRSPDTVLKITNPHQRNTLIMPNKEQERERWTKQEILCGKSKLKWAFLIGLC